MGEGESCFSRSPGLPISPSLNIARASACRDRIFTFAHKGRSGAWPLTHVTSRIVQFRFMTLSLGPTTSVFDEVSNAATYRGLPIVTPSPSRWKLRDKIAATNALIAAECRKDKRLAFADIYGLMLDAKGEPRPELFVKDMLHMNEAGYAIWKPIVAPLIK